MISLGYINYLNSQPFYYELEELSADLQIFKGNPREIINLFKNKQIDFGQMSVYEFLQNQDEYYYFPDFCISSSSIASVLLITQAKKIEDLNKQKITLTDHSITSVQLLKILLKQKYKIQSLYKQEPIQDIQESTNYLLIGDKALEAWQKKLNGDFVNWQFHNLASLWSEWTNLPFVFALFVGRKDKSLPNNILNKLQNKLKKNLKSLSQIIQINSNQRFSEPLLREYFSCLDYEITKDKIYSLQKFANLNDLSLH